MFARPEESHAHSLQTLNALYEYDDFMGSIKSVVDIGCGTGLDTEWWATRTTRDDNPEPLNIECVGVDLLPNLPMARKYSNIKYRSADFEENISSFTKNKFDVLWCHNAFQYCINPIDTLSKWWNSANDNAMLAIIVPQTTNISQKQLAFTQENGIYYHHTVVSLMHMLAVSGWDCNGGFFLKRPTDQWIHAMVYKSEHAPMNPKTTTWFDLAEKNLLPDSAKESVQRHNAVRQQDLILPWVDKSLTWLGKQ